MEPPKKARDQDIPLGAIAPGATRLWELEATAWGREANPGTTSLEPRDSSENGLTSAQ